MSLSFFVSLPLTLTVNQKHQCVLESSTILLNNAFNITLSYIMAHSFKYFLKSKCITSKKNIFIEQLPFLNIYFIFWVFFTFKKNTSLQS